MSMGTLIVISLCLCGAAMGTIAIISRMWHVYTDPRIKKITDRLPNLNCGACGYAECCQFAKAISQGKAEVAGCIHCTPKRVHEIADAIGQTITLPPQTMAVVHCKGGKKEAKVQCLYDGLSDCHAVTLIGDGQKICIDGCLGMGSCVVACPFGAIEVTTNSVAVVNSDLCNGCGLCIKQCPRGIIELVPRDYKIFLACSNHDLGAKVKKYCSTGCTACTFCVTATPSGGIEMDENLPKLNYTSQENFVAAAYQCPSKCFVDLAKARPKVNIDTKCDGCTECVATCQVHAISGEKGIRHVVNKELCIGCGICLSMCHVHAISLWGGMGHLADNRSRRFRS